MSLNQLLNPVKELVIKCETLKVSEDVDISNTLNVNHLNTSSYGYNDANARFSANSSDASITGFTETRLLVERKFLGNKNEAVPDPNDYIHYKGTIGVSANATPNQAFIIDLDVSSEGINDRNDTNGVSVICYSGRGQQILPGGTTKLQLATTTAVEVVGGKLKLSFFNVEGTNILPSTSHELDFDICILQEYTPP